MYTDYLTPHFRLADFAQPAYHGISYEPFPAHYRQQLALLCGELEAIRAHLGSPLTVLSGYYSSEFARVVGGDCIGDHSQGTAADITCRHLDPLDLYALIRGLTLAGDLHFAHVRLFPHFVHVEIPPLAIATPLCTE